MTVTLAGAPVSWGVDFADDPRNPPPSDVLEGIAAAGLRALELGPPGYLDVDDAQLAARGLVAVGTFVFHPLHRLRDRGDALDAATAAVAWLERTGGKVLVVVDRPAGARAGTAGRAADAVRLDDAGWRALTSTVREIASLAGERGVTTVLHPHAGSHIEFRDEIDRAMEALPADEVSLCVDTGHVLYAGDDPAEILLAHGDRVAHLHLKDLHPGRMAAARRNRADFWTAMGAGVFCPVGDGELDLRSVTAAFDRIGYDGFATIEQDRRTDSPGSPAADLRRSVARLTAMPGFTLA